MSQLQGTNKARRKAQKTFTLAPSVVSLIERMAAADFRKPGNFIEWVVLQEARRQGIPGAYDAEPAPPPTNP